MIITIAEIRARSSLIPPPCNGGNIRFAQSSQGINLSPNETYAFGLERQPTMMTIQKVAIFGYNKRLDWFAGTNAPPINIHRRRFQQFA